MAGSHAGRKESRFTAWRNLTTEMRKMTPWRRIKIFGRENQAPQVNPDTRGTRIFPTRRERTS